MIVKRIPPLSPVEPITAEQAKAHLRVMGTEEDAYIGALITAARAACEDFTGQALITADYKGYLPGFPEWAEIPETAIAPPIVSVQYYNPDGEFVPMTDYTLEDIGLFGRLFFHSRPATQARRDAVVVEFVAGYPPTHVPAPLKQGMLLLIRHWYDNPDGMIEGKGVDLPPAVRALWGPYRVKML